MNADLQRIGLLRSVTLVALCALLAFALWTASGASLGAHGTAEVKIRALPADRTPTTASTPLLSKSKEHARAQSTAVTTARRYLCTSASGKRYHVSAQASCLKFKPPPGKLLDRLRHRRSPAPAQTVPPTQPAPAAKPPHAQPQPAPAAPTPTQPAPTSSTGGVPAPRATAPAPPARSTATTSSGPPRAAGRRRSEGSVVSKGAPRQPLPGAAAIGVDQPDV